MNNEFSATINYGLTGHVGTLSAYVRILVYVPGTGRADNVWTDVDNVWTEVRIGSTPLWVHGAVQGGVSTVVTLRRNWQRVPAPGSVDSLGFRHSVLAQALSRKYEAIGFRLPSLPLPARRNVLLLPLLPLTG